MNAGQILDDRFLLLEPIGKGGMSTVFRAADLADGERPVVVKVPLPIFSSGVGSWSIFQREEEIGLALDHPFVLRFLPRPATRGRRAYVVTEYVPGETARPPKPRPCGLPRKSALPSTTCTAGASSTTTSSPTTSCSAPMERFASSTSVWRTPS